MVIVFAIIPSLVRHAQNVIAYLWSICLELKIEFKFTSVTLFAAMLICALIGLLVMLALKIVWDFICCREKPYRNEDDDEDIERVEDQPPVKENKTI